MHTRNIRTAAQESSRKMRETTFIALTFEQASDLFCWVVEASKDQPQPSIFCAYAESVELSFTYKEAPDYFSVWFIDGYPVAAGIPTENYFRVVSSFINQFSGVN